jgi:hypothetical protein
MNFLKQVLLIFAGSALLQFMFPWWSLMFPTIAVSYLTGRGAGSSFIAGFLAIGLLWLSLSLYIDWSTGSMLSQKIAQLFPGKSLIVVRLLTVLVGGLTGGLASLTGYSFKALR